MDHSRIETSFAKALAAIDEAVLVIGAEPRTIVACNATAERMFGYSASEMCGRSTRFLHLNDAMFEEFARVGNPILTCTGQFRCSFQLRRKDGTTFHSLNTVILLERERGIPGGAISIIRDASEVENLRRRLQKAERRVVEAQKWNVAGRLASVLAHDMKNHLTVASCNAEFLANSDLTADQRELVEGIRLSTESAATASRRLMSLARPPEWVELGPVDLNRALRDFEPIVRSSVGPEGTVSMDLADGALQVNLDESAIEQIMVNLAINAGDAMPEGGTLTVRTEPVGQTDPRLDEFEATSRAHALLVVEDTGVGMSDDVCKRALEPYFTTKGDRGTGLGLMSVDELVRMASGRIRIASEPGRGTRIEILLPLVDQPPAGE